MEQGEQVLHSKEGQSGTTRLAGTSVRSRVKVQTEATAQMSKYHKSRTHQQSDLRNRFIRPSGHTDLLNNLEGRLQLGIFTVLGTWAYGHCSSSHPSSIPLSVNTSVKTSQSQTHSV